MAFLLPALAEITRGGWGGAGAGLVDWGWLSGMTRKWERGCDV